MLHICLYHDALIPPRKYGGTERIIYWLCQALSQKGHKVTLIAQPGSDVPGTHIIALQSGKTWQSLVPADAEILHLWATPDCPPQKPYLVTIEGNGKPGERFLPNTLFISERHAKNHGAKYFVYNGLDPDSYDCPEKREDIAVFLAKASWDVKNLRGAIEIARRAGVKLHVLGSRDWPFELQRLLPPIGGVVYHGMVDDKEKRQMLARARALLFPVRWHEPFGIAITEALASGCAVFGTPYGSLPEIISPDVGVLSTRAEELAQALKDPTRFSPARCRERIFKGFSHHQMADGYLGFYERVLREGTLGQTPATLPALDLSALLPFEF